MAAPRTPMPIPSSLPPTGEAQTLSYKTPHEVEGVLLSPPPASPGVGRRRLLTRPTPPPPPPSAPPPPPPFPPVRSPSLPPPALSPLPPSHARLHNLPPNLPPTPFPPQLSAVSQHPPGTPGLFRASRRPPTISPRSGHSRRRGLTATSFRSRCRFGRRLWSWRYFGYGRERRRGRRRAAAGGGAAAGGAAAGMTAALEAAGRAGG